jgi:hypothetical protein
MIAMRTAMGGGISNRWINSFDTSTFLPTASEVEFYEDDLDEPSHTDFTPEEYQIALQI